MTNLYALLVLLVAVLVTPIIYLYDVTIKLFSQITPFIVTPFKRYTFYHSLPFATCMNTNYMNL